MHREALVQEIIENLARCQRPSNPSMWKELGLSHSQVGMIFMLSRRKRLQVKQIADFLGITKSAASQLLEPLNQSGLVVRQTDPNDRRIAYFSLSSKGLNVLKTINKLKFAGVRSHLKALNNDDLNQLAVLSRKLTNGLVQY